MSEEAGTRLFKVVDIAEALLVSRMTVYRMIKSGALPAVQFGRSFRVTEYDLRRYLEQSPTHGGDPRAIVASILHRSESGSGTEYDPGSEHTPGPSGAGR